MDDKTKLLSEFIQSLKNAVEEQRWPTKYNVNAEIEYRDYLDGLGKMPGLDVNDSEVKCMMKRIELERFINDNFADGIRIYLSSSFGEIIAYIMICFKSPREYGYDKVCCNIETLYHGIIKHGKLKESDFILLSES